MQNGIETNTINITVTWFAYLTKKKKLKIMLHLIDEPDRLPSQKTITTSFFCGL